MKLLFLKFISFTFSIFFFFIQKEESSSSSSSRNRLPERRPFNRENDLKVNRFDNAQKAAVLKKAQLLDTRFGSGESKYL